MLSAMKSGWTFLLLSLLIALPLAGCDTPVASDDDDTVGDDDDAAGDDDTAGDDDDSAGDDDDTAGDDDDSAGDDDDSAGDDDDSAGDDDDSVGDDDDSAGDDDDSAGDDDDSAAAQACSFLSPPAQYLSVGQHECGQGQSGINYCHWSLSFQAADFQWQYSDVVEAGPYECTGDTVVGNPAGPNTRTGSWDASTEVLAWEGKEYLWISPAARPDFYLPDENSTSSTYGQPVSPRDYLRKVSGWYFGHAT